jgi:hypothetical protein
MARMLQRGATIALTTTAVVLGGSGLALAATTNVVTPDPTAPVAQTVDTVTTTTTGLAPAPVAQLAPAPVVKGVTTVVKTVKSTVGGLTAPKQGPPVTEAGAPKAGPTAVHPRTPARPATPRTATQASARSGHPHLIANARLARANDASLAMAPEIAVGQQNEPTVTPQLAPSVTGPLADLPGPLQDAIPLALVIIATVIIGALAVGHLGLWWRRQAAGVA